MGKAEEDNFWRLDPALHNHMPKPAVALFHPHLGFGGSDAAVLWTIQALRDDYNLTPISGGDVDLPRLNEYYRTVLSGEDFRHRRIPFWLKSSGKFFALQGASGCAMFGKWPPNLML